MRESVGLTIARTKKWFPLSAVDYIRYPYLDTYALSSILTTHTHTHTYIYIYIYVCVCVCVCV